MYGEEAVHADAWSKKSTKSKTFSQNDEAKRVSQSGRNCEEQREIGENIGRGADKKLAD